MGPTPGGHTYVRIEKSTHPLHWHQKCNLIFHMPLVPKFTNRF